MNVHLKPFWLKETFCVTDLEAETATLFMNQHFYLKEQLTNERWLLIFRHLADIFSKMNMKDINHFLPKKKKSQNLEWKFEFWNTCIYHQSTSDLQYLKGFLDNSTMTLTNRSFWYCTMKCVNNSEDLHYSVNQYFPNDQWMMLQNHAGG